MAMLNPDTLQVLAAPENIAVDDQVSLLHEQFVALCRSSTNRNTRGLIEAALDRFEHGDYGTCEECEAEISSKRLQAIPWAARCVSCQERFEASASVTN